jgi:hypothetical protein
MLQDVARCWIFGILNALHTTERRNPAGYAVGAVGWLAPPPPAPAKRLGCAQSLKRKRKRKRKRKNKMIVKKIVKEKTNV